MKKKWWLFHATDFQTLMHPCFTVCDILGMFPYKINASTYEISQPRYILSTVVVCVYCIFYLLLIHNIINSEIITYGDVTRNLNDVCYYTFNGLIAIVTHILSNPRMRFLQTISEMYSKLPSESHQMLSKLIHIKDILIIILIVVEVIFFFSKLNLKEINCWNVLIIVFDIYLETIGFQMNMLHMNCICVLKACFKKINDDLMHVQSDMMNDIESSASSSICHMQKNQFIIIEVKTLMKQHLIISETVQKLNLIFSLQFLATVVLILFRITFALYFYVVSWRGVVHIYFGRNIFHVFLLIMMHHILKIMLTIWACETGKNEAQKIGTTICNVLNTTRDEEIKCELQLFSLQILHHKNTFSVKGLTVDATLLTAIVGRSTMYILLLMQFLIISHSCDGKSVINT